MTQYKLAASELAAIQTRGLDQLYADLALAEAGSQSDFGAATSSLAAFRSEFAAAGVGDVLGRLAARGKALFDLLWPTVEGITCDIYAEDGDEESQLAGWVEKVAAAVLAAISVTWAVAVLIVAIALRYGLKELCKV